MKDIWNRSRDKRPRQRFETAPATELLEERTLLSGFDFTKSVVASDNPNATISPAIGGGVSFNAPGTLGSRFTGVINSTYLASNALSSDIGEIDADDLITFALVFENTSVDDLFDISIRDIMPDGFAIPSNATGLNLRVTDGDNNSLSYSDLGGGLFASGIELDDSGVGAVDAHHPTTGADVLIVTYDLEFSGSGQRTIDDFSSGFQSVTVTGIGSGSDTVIGPSSAIFGTERELGLEVTQSQFGIDSRDRVLTFGSGSLIIANDPGNASITSIKWDGVGSTGLTGTDRDLLAGGGVGIVMDVVSADAGISVAVNLTDGGGDVATQTVGSLLSGSRASFQFADFTNLANVDLTDITSIELVATVPVNGDAQLDTIGILTVPSVATNIATLFNVATSEGGTDLTVTDCDATSTSTVADPSVSKSVTGTNQAHTSGLNVAVGEIVTYTATITIPEGTDDNVQLVDTLDAGLAFVDVVSVTASSGDLSTDVGTFDDVRTNAVFSNVGGGATNDGRQVTLDFGGVANNNRDNNTQETIAVVYRAVVLNSVGNDRAAGLNNSVTVSSDKGIDSNSATDVVIVEPELQVTKTIGSGTFDAGDTVSVTLDIAHTGSSDADAFNVNVLDALPTGMTNVQNVVVTPAGGAPGVTDNSAGNSLDVDVDTFPFGGTLQITFDATLTGSVAPNELITNTVNMTWTSLPGDVSAAQSSLNTMSEERDGSDGVGGALDDHAATGSDSLTTQTVTSATKAIVATSEAHTPDGTADTIADPRTMAVGEVVRYRLQAVIPEGTLTDTRLVDVLPAGLSLVDNTEVRVSWSADADVTEEADVSGADNDAIAPTFMLPASRIGVSGQTVTFDLGDIVNNDRDAGSELITLEFNVLVNNSAGNQDGTQHSNDFDVQVNGAVLASSNSVVTEVREPQISNVDKQLVSHTESTATYRITLSNTGNTTAFDTRIADAIPSSLLSLQTGTVSVTLASGASGTTDTSTATDLDVVIASIPVSGTVQVDYTTTLLDTASAITNAVDVTYTSLPGTGTAGNATGTDTPGSSGAANSERNGSDGAGAGLNNFTDSDTVVLGSIGNRVWLDLDADGIQDAGEAGVNGVTVTLVYAGPDGNLNSTGDNSSYSTTTTNVGGTDGLYSFGALPAGLYRVDFGTLNGLVWTSQNAAADDIDSDAHVVDGHSPEVPLAIGEVITHVDAGLLPIDLSLTKAVDDNSPRPDAEVTFTLTLNNAPGLSDATGVSVTDVLPTGLTFVSANPSAAYDNNTGVWTVGSLASGASRQLTITATVTRGTGTVTNITQVNTANQPDVDSTPNNNVANEDDQDSVSLTPTGAISGVFFWDMDVGADKDASEPTVGGASVRLYADGDSNGVPDGTFIAATTTNVSTGAYRFDDLTAGNYLVEFITPSGERFTTRDAVVDTVDSDVDTSTGLTATLIVTSGNEVGDVDAGLLPIDLSLIKSVDDSTPAPGSNVVFTLTLNNAAALSDSTNTTVTDVLPVGLTFVSTNQPSAYDNTTGVWTVGTLASGSSDTLTITATVDVGTGAVTNTAQVAAADQLDVDSTPNNSILSEDDQDDASLVPTGSLSGVFFWDMDLGADQDATEPTVGGATINLYTDADMNGAPDGVSVGSATTDATTGAYRFDDLAPSNYLVEFVTPNGETFTVRDSVADAIDSDAIVGTGLTGSVTVTSGNETPDVDAGLLPIDLSLTKTVDDSTPAPGSNVVFTLTLSNAAGRSTASGVTIEDALPAGLTFVSANPSAAFDDSTGIWAVGSLASGSSTALTITTTVDVGTGSVTNVAQVETADQPDTDSTPGNSVNSEDDQDDASLTPTAAISGVFFWDADSGADQDASEPIVGSATVRLYNDADSNGTPDGLAIATQTTNGLTGAYSFVDLSPSNYLVEFVRPNGERFTTQNTVSDAIDSDVDTNTGLTSTLVLAAGQLLGDVDAGILPIDLSITKTVDDVNPLPGANVTFTLTLDNAASLSDATNVTVEDVLPVGLTFVSADPAIDYDDSTGIWTVGTLASGGTTVLTVTATVDVGTGTVTNIAQVETADQVDRDSTPANDVSSEDDQDSQIVTTNGSISGVFFWDLDLGGDQDASEATVGGATVRLYRDANMDDSPDGAAIATTTTNVGTGAYRFDGLNPNNYVVEFVRPNGETFTVRDAVADTIDSDADVTTGFTTTRAVATGEETADVDAGLLPIDLSLTKTVDDSTPAPGSDVTFTITLVNSAGLSNATGVTVGDLLPAGLTFASANPAANYNDTFGTWTVGALASGSSTALTINATVDAGTGPVTNVAEVKNADQVDRDSIPNNNMLSEDDQDDASIVPTGSLSGVFFWDMDSGADQDAGEPTVGGATVRLYADANTDGSPDGASITTTTTNVATGAYLFNDLAGGTYLVEFVTPNSETFTTRDAVGDTIDSDAKVANGLTRTVTVTAGNETQDVDAGLLPIDLSLFKTVDVATPAPGSNVVFTLSLSNAAGVSDASNVVVEDALPAGLTFVSANPSVAYDSNTNLWTAGSVAAGASTSLTITATVDAGTGVVTNVAQVHAVDQPDVDSTPNNNVLSEDDQDDATITPTASIEGVFFWDLDSGEDQDASEPAVGGATVQLFADANLDGSPDGGPIATQTTNVTTGAYRFDDLAPSSYLVQFTQPNGERFTVRDAVTDTIDSDVIPATGVTGTVTANAGQVVSDVDAGLLPIDLSLSKTVDDDTPAPGSSVVFTLSLTNVGGLSDATNVKVTDALPAGLSFVSANPSSAFNSSTGEWTVGTLVSGSSTALTINASVDAGTCTVTNVAQVSAADQLDVDSTPANNIISEDDQDTQPLTPTGLLSGVFFWDMDLGSDQDASEPTVGGATVRVYRDSNVDGAADGGVIATVATNAITGAYRFDDLSPDGYVVEFVTPNGERFTVQDAVHEVIDSDVLPTSGFTSTVMVTSGNETSDVDAGLLPIDLSLTKTVDDDTPAPGSNVVFTLTVSNAGGLSDGTGVSVTDVLPAGLTFVSANPAANYDDNSGVWSVGSLASGASTTLDITATVEIGTGVVTNVSQVFLASQPDVDSTPNNSVSSEDDQDSQSLTPTGSLSGVQFWDMDVAGDQDAGEPVVGGQTVRLYLDADGNGSPDGAAIATTTTNGVTGAYLFDGLAPTNYIVEFTTPNGETFTARDAVSDTIDSDANVATGRTGSVLVTSGLETTDVDAGLLPIDLSITKTVDDDRPSAAQSVMFTLTLRNAVGLSNASGVVVEDVLPAGLTFVSASPAADYDDNTGLWTVGSLAAGTSTVLTVTATVDAGTGAVTNITQVNAADQPDVDSTPDNNVSVEDDQDSQLVTTLGTITGVFFWDVDSGGDQDATEPTVNGATVWLYEDANMDGVADGAAVDRQTTDSSGVYRFDGLNPGGFLVGFVTPNGERFTTQDAVADTIDSDPSPSHGLTRTVVVNAGQFTDDVDAGLLPIDLLLNKLVDDASPAPGSNVVFTLTLGNVAGLSDASGVNVADALPVGLTFVSASPASDFDGNSGIWNVGALAAGTSKTLTITATVNAGTGTVTNTAQVSAADQVDVDSTPGNNLATEDDQDDASITPTGSLSGVFFMDMDATGDQDATEPIVGGATVRLYRDANQDRTADGASIATTTTHAATGAYLFDGLTPGGYVVEFLEPNGETFTLRDAAGDAIDSDVNPATGFTGTAIVMSGNETPDVDAGLLPIDLSLIKTVDDATPAPGSNVTFTLLLSNATGLSRATGVRVTDVLPSGLAFVSASPSAAFNSNSGVWTVGSLPAGSSTSLTITATVNPGTGVVTNVAQVSAADQLDRDSTPNNNVLSEDDQDDATITPTAVIEGVFFWDTDVGGDRDASEPIVGGATVRLYVDANRDNSPDGGAIATTTTNTSTGAYRFDGLAQAGYLVEFMQPNGERFTVRDAVGDTNDSDVSPSTGLTGTVMANAGQVVSNVDAGLLPIDLALTKTVDDNTPAPGSNVVFTLLLSNAGGLSDATDVNVTDVLPAGLTFVSADPSAAFNSNTGVWSVGTLPSGSSTSLTITATVDVGTGAVTNTGQVSNADQPDVDSTTNNSVASEDDQDDAAIMPTGALLGVFFWDMDVAGDQDASEPAVGGATVRLYRDANSDGAADGGEIASTVTNAVTGAYRFDGLLAGGHVVEFVTPNGETFTARDVVGDSIDSDVLPATGFTGTVNVLPGNETTDIDAGLLPVDLSLTKGVDDTTPAPGSNVTFTLTLSNSAGLSGATGVNVTDVLPVGLTFVSASPSVAFNSSTGVWTVGSVASNTTTSLTIVATVDIGTGSVSNVAQVSAADQLDVDSTPGNNATSEDDQDDVSLTPTGSLSGVFFMDMDSAGDQDASEPIVGGATVRLYLDANQDGSADGSSIRSATTNGTTGAFRFDGLTASGYVVEFVTPNGDTFTSQNAVGDAIDSDVNPGTGFTGTAVVFPGNETTDVDAGLLPIDLSLTKTVDDATPAPGSNVVFTLTVSNAAGLSDASGVRVVDVLPNGLTFVSASPSAAFNSNSGVWTVGSLTSGASTSLTITATVNAGTGAVTNVAQVSAAVQLDRDSTPNNSLASEDDQDDASIVPTGSLSGVLFWDMDLAGDQDTSEPVVGGQTVRLYWDADANGSPDGSSIASTTTDPSTGAYRFDGLAPNNYIIGFTTPNGEAFTTQNAVNDVIDSDAKPMNGRTGSVIVASGSVTTDVDAGLLPIDLSLTKTVDDASPVPGSNVTFTLMLTNAGGRSDATGVAVRDVLPAGMVFVSASPSAAFNSGSGVWSVGSLASGATTSIVITANVPSGVGPLTNVAQVSVAEQPDVDSTPNNNVSSEDDQDSASITPTGSLSGAFFWDIDVAGDQDATEPVVGGASVRLYEDSDANGVADGVAIASTTTNTTTGAYQFNDLTGSNYVVEFVTPRAESFTARDVVDDTIDSDVSSTGFTGSVSVVSGQKTTDVDAGLLPIDLSLTKSVNDSAPAPGSNVVFTLTVNNAAGRSNASGVTVSDVLPSGLTFVSASPAASFNNSTGVWSVGSLTAGASSSLTITATVDIGTGSVTNRSQVRTAEQPDQDSTPNNNVLNEDDQDDASLTPTGSLSGAFFWDMDTAGDQDASEPIVGGATVRLFADGNSDGVPDGSAVASTITNASTGAYQFDGLNPGGFVVEFTAPSGETFTARDVVADDVDSDANPVNGRTGTVLVVSGNETTDVDAGLLPIDLSLTKTVNDDTPTPGSNVVFMLTLSNAAGLSTATGVSVTDVLPSGLVFLSASPSASFNSNTGVWSVGTLRSGTSTSLTITANVAAGTGAVTNSAQVTSATQPDRDSTPNNDVPSEDDQDAASLTPTGSLSGVFFWDMDVAGDQDASEPIVGGQVVSLYRDTDANGVADGAAVGSTTTNSSGTYRFDDLTPGEYIVEFTTVNDETFTARDAVSDLIDSDADSAGLTHTVTVLSGIETTDVDAGLLPIDLSLTKTVDDELPNAGQDVEFTLALTNAPGRSSATGVTVTDVLPSGLTFVSAVPSSEYDSATGVWTVGSLASAATRTLRITASVDSDAEAVTNVAEVTTADQPDVDSVPDNDSLPEDDRGEQTITVTGSLTGVFFWDIDGQADQDSGEPSVGSGTVYLFADADADGEPDGPAIAVTWADHVDGTYRFDDLLPGNYVVAFEAPNGESFTASDATSNDIDDSDANTVSGRTQSVNVAAGGVTTDVDAGLLPIDLSLAKTVDNDTPVAGTNVTFTLTVSNAADAGTASGVSVTDAFPTGLSFVSASPSAEFNSTTGVWTVGTLPAGTTRTLQVTSAVVGFGTIINTAEVTSANQPDRDSIPNNRVPTEDDIDSQSIQSQVPAEVSISDAEVVETHVGFTELVFNVTLSQPLPIGFTLDFETTDGTALVSDDDYVPTTGKVRFEPNQTTAIISIPTVGDYGFEHDETLVVTMTNPSIPSLTIADGQGIGVIINDDLNPEGHEDVLVRDTGTIGLPDEVDKFKLNITQGYSKAFYGILISGLPGGELRPDVVSIMDADGNDVSLSYRKVAPSGNLNQSLAVVRLAPGEYTVCIKSIDDTIGDYQLDVFLPGDTGHHLVPEPDIFQLVNGILSQSPLHFFTSCNFDVVLGINHQTGEIYSINLDANRNGRLDEFDQKVVSNNAVGKISRAELIPLETPFAVRGFLGTTIPLQSIVSELDSPFSDGAPTITWSADSIAKTYEVVISDSTNADVQHVTGITSTSYTVTPSLPSGSYTVQVRGVNSAGQGGLWSSPQRFTVDGDSRRRGDGGEVTDTLHGALSNLDVDGSGDFQFSSDGIILLAHALGARGDQLASFRAAGSQTSGQDIQSNIDNMLAALDLDGDGEFVFSNDGIILLAHSLGSRGEALAAFASPTSSRNGVEIENQINALVAPRTAARQQTGEEVAVGFGFVSTADVAVSRQDTGSLRREDAFLDDSIVIDVVDGEGFEAADVLVERSATEDADVIDEDVGNALNLEILLQTDATKGQLG